jgi:hypothetical protein
MEDDPRVRCQGAEDVEGVLVCRSRMDDERLLERFRETDLCPKELGLAVVRRVVSVVVEAGLANRYGPGMPQELA